MVLLDARRSRGASTPASSTSTAPVLGDFIVGLDGLDVNGTTLHTAQRSCRGATGPAASRSRRCASPSSPCCPACCTPSPARRSPTCCSSIGLALIVFEFFTAGRRRRGRRRARCSWCSALRPRVLPTRPVAAAAHPRRRCWRSPSTSRPACPASGPASAPPRSPAASSSSTTACRSSWITLLVGDRRRAPRDGRRHAGDGPHPLLHADHRPGVDDRRAGRPRSSTSTPTAW